tara:strand:- start:448 stop:1221 length:774 start_codon:yes stop_codon:yes gene_type:complete
MFFSSCEYEDKAIPQRVEVEKAEVDILKRGNWSYTGSSGQQNWSSLKEEYSLCSEGKRQSPIDINSKTVKLRNEKFLSFFYSLSSLSILNEDHTIKLLPNDNSSNYIIYKEQKYNLLFFDIHSLSEHKVDNEYYPGELQFFHQNEEGDRLIVVVLLDLESYVDQSNFKYFWDYILLAEKTPLQILGEMNLQDLLPKDRSYFSYEGSLTVPPCTENVEWIVLKSSVSLSRPQLELFQSVHSSNFRKVQGLNGRVVYSH